MSDVVVKNRVLCEENRLVIESCGVKWDYYNDGTLSAVKNENSVTISVSQEKAVDSYSREFECFIDLTNEGVAALVRFLLAAYDASRK